MSDNAVELFLVPACGLELNDAAASGGISTTRDGHKEGIRRGKTEGKRRR
jgi:hypothetical protein